MPRSIQVMIAASLGFFFVTATTFTSLGYVLYTMVADLGWSQAAAGLSFSLLGLACGMSSPLPPVLMKMIGTRMTMFAGAMVLAAGFLLAATIHSLGLFFLATTLMGIGFSLVAPSPAVYLLATWFEDRSSRMIGFYFMIGSAGGIAGPLIVSTIVGLTGDWRLNWLIMAIGSVLLGLICLVCIRDKVKVESVEQVTGSSHVGNDSQTPSPWTVRAALTSPSFLILAAVMAVVQMAVTSAHSILVTYIARMDGSAGSGAIAMSLLAFFGAGAKGVTGHLTEKVDPKGILVAGLAVQAVAMALLWSTTLGLVATAGAALFGLGWGMSWLSAHILILRYFGARIAGDMVAMATTATTVAVLGPVVAGRVADVTGSYHPAVLGLSVILAVTTVAAALFLRAPRTRPLLSSHRVADLDLEADLFPAE